VNDKNLHLEKIVTRYTQQHCTSHRIVPIKYISALWLCLHFVICTLNCPCISLWMIFR